MEQEIATYRCPFVHPFGEMVINLLRRSGPNALILDVGGGGDRYLNLPGYINLEIEKSCKPTVVGDAHYLPFRDDAFDIVICEAVIEHLRKPWIAADEIFRVTKRGGYVYVESAFMQPLHNYPGHYFNTTKQGLRYYLKGSTR